MRWLRRAATIVGLYVAYVVLFLGGAAVLGPGGEAAALTPSEQAASLYGTLAAAAVDLALMGAWLSRARSSGWRLWLESFLVFYGVKTFSSQLETWYFVPADIVPPEMLPTLFLMTLPLAVGWTGLATWAWGPRERKENADPGPALWRLLLAGAVLYPFWFFWFGYSVAWQNDAVRAYYAGPAEPLPLLQHYAQMISADPFVVPFEMFRGLLWLAIGWPVIRGTKGPWWLGWVLFAAMMALVQNDLHWLPNPLMPTEVRFWHFWETSTSNFLFVLSAAALSRVGAVAGGAPARYVGGDDVQPHQPAGRAG
jgi:hypothetical protein